MLAVFSTFPDNPKCHPAIALIHGAANSAKVWKFWQEKLAVSGWTSHAIDLRGHGHSSPVDLSHTSMGDYADDVRKVIKELPQPPVVMGWSMGGLVALMVASQGDAVACVALAPSTPTRGVDKSVTLRSGEFGPEEYGVVGNAPYHQPTMPDLDLEERGVALASHSRESRLARDERRAGIVIESLPCPLLIVTGTADTSWPRTRYDDIWIDTEFYAVEGASHWGLVLNRRALAVLAPRVLQWLAVKI